MIRLMAEIIVFTAGCFLGWFAHQYREKLKRIKNVVEEELKEFK